jgi:hypothetical protein
MLVLFVFCIMLAVCCTGCGTYRGMVSDPGIGAAEYRGIQEDIRSGEVDLAVTGTRVEDESRELGIGISQLEQSITESTGTEQPIDAILQRVRGRKVDASFVERWGTGGVESEK